MSAPPGAARTEVPVLLGNGVGADSLQRTPRRWKRDAIRVLLDLGYTATPNQALALLHEYRAWQADDARRFIAAEFRAFVQRRGDLIQPRMKRNYRIGETGWRTAT